MTQSDVRWRKMFGFFGGRKNEAQQAPIEPSPPATTPQSDVFLTDQQVEDASFVIPKKEDDIEYLFIRENPFLPVPEVKTGTFGPLPMRTNSDKLQYGTGSMYLSGLPRRLDLDF